MTQWFHDASGRQHMLTGCGYLVIAGGERRQAVRAAYTYQLHMNVVRVLLCSKFA
jgi:hypothetical protein